MSQIDRIIEILDEILGYLEYLQSLYFLFDIESENINSQRELAQKMIEERQKYLNILQEERISKRKALILNEIEVIEKFTKISNILKLEREKWKNGNIKIVCSDSKLIELVHKIQKDGVALELKKQDISSYFDFSKIFSRWNDIPNYTIFVVGEGIAISSPEQDFFRYMTWFYDESLRLHNEKQTQIQLFKNNSSQFNQDYFFKITTNYKMMCVQTVINAFLLLEAFLNSLSYSYIEKYGEQIDEDRKLLLLEQTKDKTGKYRQKYVSIENKLIEWVKIISPRGISFDRGEKIFQKFIKMKNIRDALVHLSGEKVPTYISVDFDTVQEVVETLIDIINQISIYIGDNPEKAHLPWWLQKIQDDGFFNLPDKFKPLSYT